MSIEYKFTHGDLKVLRDFLEEMKFVPKVEKMENMTSRWWNLCKLDEAQIREYMTGFKHHRVHYRSLIGDVWCVEKEYVDDVFGVCAMLRFGNTVRLTESQCMSLLKIGVPCDNDE